MESLVTDAEASNAEQAAPCKKTVLFLCSGNYYRSRFAECYFDWLAQEQGLPWRAISRGFRLNPLNVGPISPLVAATLAAWQVPATPSERDPIPASASDLRDADLVIAVKESEHRPMAERYHPGWVDRIQYWQIDDVDCAPAEAALLLLADRIRALIEALAKPGANGSGVP